MTDAREELLAEFETDLAAQEMRPGDVTVAEIMAAGKVKRYVALRRAMDRVIAGELTTALVHGPSGRMVRVFRKKVTGAED
jgi:hypothetical protein